MDIRTVIFDVNGTLVDIVTDEGMEQIFRSASHLLTYQGIDLRRHQLRELYFQRVKAQQAASSEQYPEFDVVEVWRTIVDDHATAFTHALPAVERAALPLLLAELGRGISRRRLRVYPHVFETLDVLRRHLPLAVVTDAQSAFARAELHKVGLLDYFSPIVVSGDHGFRKPDGRLFRLALAAVGVPAAHAMYVGNDMYRDVYGAREAGLTTVMYTSDQGTKHHQDCVADFTISDHRELLGIVGLAAQ